MNNKRSIVIWILWVFHIISGALACGNFSSHQNLFPSASENGKMVLGSESRGIIVTLNQNGTIENMKVHYSDGWEEVKFRSDNYSGPGFGSQVTMKQKSPEEAVFYGESAGVMYQLAYTITNGMLHINATVRNNSDQNFTPKRLPLLLGIDTYMDTYPQWNNLYFPTFLRCEPTHFWGYFMTPLGKILGISSRDPVGSYTIEYQNTLYSHYIYTASLDLLQKPPLPDHHPAYKPLAAGEKRSWTIDVLPIDKLSQIKPALARNCEAPMMDLYNYTLEPDQPAEIFIYSPSPVTVSVINPAGKEFYIKAERKAGTQLYKTEFPQTGEYGYYDICVKSDNNKVSKGRFFVRPRWSWYINCGRQEALRLTPRADLDNGADGFSCEAYYGLLGFWLAAKHFPDPPMDVKGDQILEKVLARLFKEKDGMYFSINSERIQNGSFMISVLVDRYQATGNIESLETANEFAEFILSRQHKDGYYGGYNMAPYTSVLYIAKSINELMEEEKELGKKDAKWEERYQRHFKSVKLAIDDLVRRKLDVKTEGGSTFEDGSVSCSAAQIAMFALMQTDPAEREKYTASALGFLDAHASLTRLLSPDTRSNGGTIRWWEAWNDNKVDGQMTTSPHGWSGWRLYSVYYLYLLTGKEDLLSGVMNALGSCSQLMQWPSGRLHQAYVIDPYIEAFKSVPDLKEPYGKKIPHIYGEEYLETIGEWYGQTTQGNNYLDRVEGGWSGDQIPFEIFKAMEEFALTAAYVIEREDGSIKTYNCSFMKNGSKLTITPSESIVNRIHFNLRNEYDCTAAFTNHNEINALIKGMKWIQMTNQ